MGGHHAMTPEEVKKHVRGYMVVFGALLCLTGVTVWVSYLHLPVFQAVLLAMVVASIKASLVALYFMHLISEQKIIYYILGVTIFMFFVCLAISHMIYMK